MDGFHTNRLPSHEEMQSHHHHHHHNHHHHHQQQQQRISIPAQSSASMRGPHTAHPSAISSVQLDTTMTGGDSLDVIIHENHHELQRRRRSVPHSFGHGAGPVRQDPPSPRISFMEFGIGDDGFGGYQFTAGHGLPTNYPDMAGSLGLPGQLSAFASQGVMPLGGAADFTTLSPDMMTNMIPATFANMRMNLDQMNQETSSMGLYASGAVPPHYGPGPVAALSQDQDFPMDMTMDDGQMGAGTTSAPPPAPMLSVDDHEHDHDGADTVMSTTPTNTTGNGTPNQPPSLSLPTPDPNMGAFSSGVSRPMATLAGQGSSASSFASPGIPTPKVSSPPTLGPPQTPTTVQSASTPTMATTTPLVAGPARPALPTKGGTYSKSGFDCLTALWLVASRKNPEINLGAVDLSCAFVICDVQLNDCPIIYVSPNFQNLTGYHTNEILGKNCRFLQAPDGKVEAGSRREFVDDGAVYNLKEKISQGREVQQSLINYRKGGKPFLNLLTMIPISWTDTDEIRYFVGFQIDIVESPGALSSDAEAGGTQINYKHSEMGQYVWTPPQTNRWGPENGQSLGEDDVSTLLQQLRPKGILSDWHRQSWDKMLLENVDDVVHVLSLKGVFLYMSPACKRVLEYDANELAGKSVSEYCHPSDRISVERVLKDAVPGVLVNLAWRMRRKHSGFMWMESHGSLYVEQGKGRKCVILVGRQRPVLALGRRSLEIHGGMGDSDLWAKVSTSGMFLFVSSNARSLLDMQPSTLVGTSIQDMMRKESRAEFGRSIEKARRGKIVSCKHEVQHRRGQVLQAQTILYPGDAVEGEKPTFLVAQTKLVKASSRALAPAAGGGPAQAGMPPMLSPQTKFPPVPRMGSFPGTDHVGHRSTTASSHDSAMEAKDNLFNELRATKCSSWQFELRQMEKDNRILAEELGGLLSNKKKRKRRQGVGNMVRDCANCHTRDTPEWRRGPSGQRDLCNSCGLRYAKQVGRVSPRTSSRGDPVRGGGSSSDHGRSVKTPTNSKKETPPDTSEGTEWEGVNSGINGKSGSGDLTPTGAKPAEGPSSMPPLSQPSLDGGSRSGMTAIQEEAGAG